MINRWFLLGVLGALCLAGVVLFVLFAPSPADETGTEEIVIPIAPVGPVAGAPEEIRWNPVRGARAYRVEILDGRGEPLWEGESDRESIPFPEELRDRVLGGGVHFYRIVAKGRFGAEILSSEKVLFRCRPAEEG